MIKILFTKSNKIGSKLIRDITVSESSHMAWLLDDHLIFHSNHEGCHPEWAGRFLKDNDIVFTIPLNLLTIEQEEKLYIEILKYDGQPYDVGAFWYQGLAWLGYKAHLSKLVSANKWGSKNRQLCLELANPLKIFGIELPPLDTMVPDALYYYLKGALFTKLYR